MNLTLIPKIKYRIYRSFFISFTLLFLSHFGINGQNKVKVEGYLKNVSNKAGVSYIIVNFDPQESQTEKIQGQTDADGYFRMNLPSGNYELTVLDIKSKKIPVIPSITIENDSIDLGDLFIKIEDIALDEVVISAQKPFIKYEPNRMLIDLAANPATEKGSVTDGLLKIPGINVSPMGDISLYGLYSITVYLDDRPSNMGLPQLYDYLSSISVDDLETVELITNPGSKYGKNTQTILNIKLKRNAQDGINGFISGTGEYFNLFSEKSSARLNVNKGISKNYVSYSFSNYQRTYDTGISYIPKDSASFDSDYNLKETEELKPQQTQWINLGSDLSLNSKNVLGAKISIGGSSSNFCNQSMIQTSKEKIATTSDINSDYVAFIGNVYYAFTNNSLKWTNNFDYSRNQLERNTTESTNAAQNQNVDDNYHLYRVMSDLSAKLSPVLSISAGINSELTNLNSQASNTNSVYDYYENNHALYVSLGYSQKKNFLEAGLRLNYEKEKGKFQKLSYDVDTNLLIFQPSFLIVRNLNNMSQLKFSYNKTYIRPNYRDIVPFGNNTGTFVRRIGNPELQISKEDLLSISYNYLKSGIISLSFSHTKSPIVEAIIETPHQLTLYKTNLDKSDYFRFLIATPTIPYLKKRQWSGVTYFAIHRQFDKGIINTQPYSADFTTFFFQHKEIVNLPSKWYFDTQVTYYSPLIFGVYEMKTQWWIDLSVSKILGDFRISLQANNIFNTNKANGKYTSTYSNLNFHRDWNFPDFRLTATYNFGKKKMNPYKARSEMKNLDRIRIDADQGISDKKQ